MTDMEGYILLLLYLMWFQWTKATVKYELYILVVLTRICVTFWSKCAKKCCNPKNIIRKPVKAQYFVILKTYYNTTQLQYSTIILLCVRTKNNRNINLENHWIFSDFLFKNGGEYFCLVQSWFKLFNVVVDFLTFRRL